VQFLKVGLQVLPILLFGDLIHPYRRRLALPVVGALQRRPINQIGQRMKLGLRLLPRACRYLPE